MPKSEALTAYWLRQAAKQGDASAQMNLAEMYQVGYGVKRNLAAARYWFRQAAHNRSEDKDSVITRERAAYSLQQLEQPKRKR